MLAAVITGARRLELREFAEPVPFAGGVVVEVSFCGICGTDLGAYSSGRPYRPALCGHEWTGTIASIGIGVDQVSEGDRVVVGLPTPCGQCGECRAGRADHCRTVVAMLHGRDPAAPAHGGFAPRIAVPVARVVAAHPGLDDETLAQVEPVSICLHAVERSGLIAGDTVAVLGAGPVGLTTAQCAAAMGAARVIVIEPDDERRALAVRLGARGPVPVLAGAVASARDLVDEHTAGLGVDVVFDCVGGGDALADSVGLTRRGGTVCIVGLAHGPAVFEPADWLRKEITVTTTMGYVRRNIEAAMQLLVDGRVRVADLHTSTTRLDALPEVFEQLTTAGNGQLKVLVNPNWSSNP